MPTARVMCTSPGWAAASCPLHELAERLPRAALHVGEGGHACWVQDPRALPDIVEFLTQP